MRVYVYGLKQTPKTLDTLERTSQDVRSDLGYNTAAEPQQQTKPLHHKWKLTHRQHHQARHVCVHCACVRTRTQGQEVTSTRYQLGKAITDRAPPCIDAVTA
jgi:hypothetical protein